MTKNIILFLITCHSLSLFSMQKIPLDVTFDKGETIYKDICFSLSPNDELMVESDHSFTEQEKKALVGGFENLYRKMAFGVLDLTEIEYAVEGEFDHFNEVPEIDNLSYIPIKIIFSDGDTYPIHVPSPPEHYQVDIASSMRSGSPIAFLKTVLNPDKKSGKCRGSIDLGLLQKALEEETLFQIAEHRLNEKKKEWDATRRCEAAH